MKFLAIFSALALFLTGCGAAGSQSPAFRQMDMKDAVQRMEEETGYLILDVRTPAEYAEGHIPGAINVPNESIGSEAPEALPDKDQLIFVYCRSGNRSKQAAGKLAKLGYSNLTEIGGIRDWPGDLETE